ncbi:MAG: M20 family peptidase [Chloroflexi bacterium]|nr:M20 family peptidase [Chloroflexota bacterium]
MLSFLLPVLVLILFLVAVLLFRTAMYSSSSEPVEPAELVDIDDWTAAEHLSRAIRCQTISHQDPELFDRQAFLSLHKELESMYPRLHRLLKLEKVNQYSLLYTWPGSNPELKPILLMSHLDVVPVEAGSEKDWEHPPFSGEIAEGFVWGRGALDIKCGVTSILEAVECLVQGNFQPERTIYLAFGHDEEVSGMDGAGSIAKLLQERGVELETVVDEGGALVTDVVPWVDRPVAMVGVGEKGYLSLALAVDSPGGHSAAPPVITAIGRLSGAIHRLETQQMPDHLGTIKAMYHPLADELPMGVKMVFANLWLFGGWLRSRLEAMPRTAALIRTTTAPTMISAGVKDNILPRQARAVVNFRVLPEDTIQDVVDHVKRVIGDPEVRVESLYETAIDPSPEQAGESVDPVVRTGRAASPVSDPLGPGYALLDTTIRQVFPDAAVAPTLTTGATDARYYVPLCAQVFRFMPIRMTPVDQLRPHGVNERISIKNIGDLARFFARWIQISAG